ncbi:MAG: hypothetical protein ACOC1F_07210 [Myxococcota bacterium]
MPALFLPACSACSESASPHDGVDASGVDSGATGGSGGTGYGGMGGSGGTRDASVDLNPEGSPDTADAGPAPLWESMGEHEGLLFERVSNPEPIRVFHWVPCPGVSDCEMAEFLQPDFHGDTPNLQYLSMVHDNGTDVFAGIGFVLPKKPGVLTFTTADGWLVEGFKCTDSNGRSGATQPAVWGARYGFTGAVNADNGVFPGVLGTLGTTERSFFTLNTMQAFGPGAGNGTYPMGETRWVWNWAPKLALVSFSNVDASDPRMFAETSTEILSLGRPSSAGSHFLFDELRDDNGGVSTRIMSSDGVQLPAPYLVPGPGEYYFVPRFADSHVGWLRATGMQDPATFDHVEIWATVYSPSPAELSPYKVADVENNKFVSPSAVGGFGHYARSAMTPGFELRSISIWNLDTKVRVERLTPDFAQILKYLGVTRTHLWMTGTIPSSDRDGDYLFRFPLD